MNLLIYSHYFAPSVGGVETIVQSLAAGASAPVSMRIAVISPFLDRSHGTERCIVEQLERLALDSGTEIHIYAQRVQDVRGVTLRKYGAPVKSVDHDVETKPVNRLFWHKVPSIPGPHLLQYIFWFFANRLCRWWDATFRNARYDLLYSPGINATDADAISVHVVFHEFYRQVLPQLHFRNAPLRAWPRLAHQRAYYRLIMALENRIYRRPTVSLAAVSASAASLLDKYFHPATVRVIRHGVDIQSFSLSRRLAERTIARKHFNLSAEDFALLLIGNDWRTKGLAALLQSLALIRELPWKLFVVGRDVPDPYDKMIRDYGISGRVIFFPPSPNVVQFYAAADAYVGPSLEDAYGLPVLEAMACGLPVLASSRAGVSEIIDDGISGIILRDPRDTQELLSGLRRLMTDPLLRRKLGEQAERTAQNQTWDRNAQHTWEWLIEVARNKKASSHTNS
jgi:UDP-glucose:(heptosyl)LPS alpha-1,3-glucosyltransferase